MPVGRTALINMFAGLQSNQANKSGLSLKKVQERLLDNMQSVAGGRLGAVLRHLSKMSPHKPLNVLPCQISTQVTDRMLSGVNVVSKDTVSCSHVFRPWDFDDFERLVPLGTIVNQMVLTSYLIGKHYFFQPPKERNNEPVFSLAPYIWYCMDCATLGARSGAYSVLSGDLAKYNLKMLEVLYQNESLEGDILDIESWEDQDSPDTLRFQVKKGNENITQLTMQFYLQTV
ncbi:Hypp3583 [Branchiostoma lanceolatum]|uniref:Hypp3583 protein n=1 Tax=Branchiostoma lanceolatum TaxID=7740 RepID=A0A8K0EXH7_BRALA|nr:Hypp3583 [Branchiostoma lanceolatum]